jgi:hypothetical protein
LILVAGCGPGAPASASPAPSSPSPGPVLGQGELRYALVDRFGRPWFCDPDEYPVGRDETAAMRERFPDVQADVEAFSAILERLSLDRAALDDAQRLAIYRDWKMLNAIVLDPIGNGRFRFDYLALPAPGATEGTRTSGTVDEHGVIAIDRQAAAGEPVCPICLDARTTIATPDGPRRVDELRVGDAVWTADSGGRRLLASVVQVGFTPVPPSHRLVELVLSDGRSVHASPGHSLADGRTIGELSAGDMVDGARVMSAGLVGSGPRTWDVLPSGPTGTYWADGILLKSTLGDGGH